jgi:hypothetical protein
MFAESFQTNFQLIICHLCLENSLTRSVWCKMFVEQFVEQFALIRSSNNLLPFIEPGVFVIVRKPQPVDPALSKFTYLHHTSLNNFTHTLPFMFRSSEWYLRLMSSDEHKTCLFIYFRPYILYVDRGGTVVKVLCYKSQGRWSDSRWCHWNFSLT